MKFTVSSTDLTQDLFMVSKAIAAKSTLPILDNFLFVLEGNNLVITGSDSETTFKTVIALENVVEEGRITVPAKILTEAIKGLYTQPIEISTDEEKKILNIIWQNGNANIPYMPADDYPQLKPLEEPKSITLKANVLSNAISNTIYATSDDYLRPAMNGIFFDLSEEQSNIVASNSHILVTFSIDAKGEKSSFSLPKKAANLLKNALAKMEEEDVEISYDSKFAYFKFDQNLLVSKLIEGNFPNYKAVIPQHNENLLSISRADLLNATRRVTVLANPATSQIVLKLSFNQIEISTQDVAFSTSAREQLICEYNGTPMEISLKANFFEDILNNLPYEQIVLKFKDSTKPMLIVPAETESQEEKISVLLMPMIVTY